MAIRTNEMQLENNYCLMKIEKQEFLQTVLDDKLMKLSKLGLDLIERNKER